MCLSRVLRESKQAYHWEKCSLCSSCSQFIVRTQSYCEITVSENMCLLIIYIDSIEIRSSLMSTASISDKTQPTQQRMKVIKT